MKDKIFFQLKEGKGKYQLICFPFLGGYANSFFELAGKLGEDIEVWAANPPGHGTCDLKPLTDIRELLDLYYKELQGIIKPNCVFYGHSMGGIVAYFLAQRILKSEEYSTKPVKLIMSACETPGDYTTKDYSGMSDDMFIEHLISYNGIPDALIQEKSLLTYFLPVFRADFNVLDTSTTMEFNPFDIPAYYLWGENDKTVPFNAVIQWSNYFTNEINIFPIEDGRHMFIYDKIDLVAKHLEDIVSGNAL